MAFIRDVTYREIFARFICVSHSLSFPYGKCGSLNTAIYLPVMLFMFPLLSPEKDKSLFFFKNFVICSMHLPFNRDISLLILTNKEHYSASINNTEKSPTLKHSALTLSFVSLINLTSLLCIYIAFCRLIING